VAAASAREYEPSEPWYAIHRESHNVLHDGHTTYGHTPVTLWSHPLAHPQEFEKKEPRIKARASTNLAFLYSLEGENEAADKYADLALKSDRYNARAFVNKVSEPVSLLEV
jgi:hypothetical protein